MLHQASGLALWPQLDTRCSANAIAQFCVTLWHRYAMGCLQASVRAQLDLCFKHTCVWTLQTALPSAAMCGTLHQAGAALGVLHIGSEPDMPASQGPVRGKPGRVVQEPLAVLRTTLSQLAAHDGAASRYLVVLAMEVGERGHAEKAVRLTEEFEGRCALL